MPHFTRADLGSPSLYAVLIWVATNCRMIKRTPEKPSGVGSAEIGGPGYVAHCGLG